MQELFKKTEIGNAEALRSQSAVSANSSAMSAFAVGKTTFTVARPKPVISAIGLVFTPWGVF